MHIAVIGTGYVGLVTGACFAEMGVQVVCVDQDAAKIDQLKQGRVSIYEPGLESLVRSGLEQQRLSFTTSLPQAMAQAQILFIAVGTPPEEDGSADLQHVLAVAGEIGRNLRHYTVIVNKSTVPVGTADRVRAAIRQELEQRDAAVPFDVVSNPEFLKEGSAVVDFTRPDRIIIGSDSERATERMKQLYAPFIRNHDRTLTMGVRDAEMTKYAANALLATKISFMNEIANLCEPLGVDVENVRLGIGSDSRIGYHFIYPGCGYGGSCFPKDVKALSAMARQSSYEPLILKAVEERNKRQRQRLFEKIQRHFHPDLAGLTIALWGLSFKPGTDDMREAPAVFLLQALMKHGVQVRAYDPAAMEEARRILPADWFTRGQLHLVRHQYEALEQADALVLVTEWKPFRTPDFAAMKSLMKQRVIFDGRNQYDPVRVRNEGFAYEGIGR
ncbi:UDP-glucose dehydrogenase family protein [Desulfuromonas thiophila]|uniref:UDP-glucose 6-dehydrogenase n=1 Tax=Desulfuromonas thiophila TaxID=57664 RepID=A0A1G7EUC4_9BACT|nr:UDP-glucose/GDP-mannose dehydrogenase family protein [Desulfuromonas thiophila]SDE67284.1 UDPglucose 6-dehydrogenase [Desulfuromonas thiophila]